MLSIDLKFGIPVVVHHQDAPHMPLSQVVLRKMLALFLAGFGIVTTVSSLSGTKAEAQDRERELKPMSLATQVIPNVMAKALASVVPLDANSREIEAKSDSEISSGPPPKAPELGIAATKTIAIDSELDNGEAPTVTNMEMVQFAAQMWANASFPVEQFQAYTSPFGYRSSPTGGYRQEFHYGLDIAAPQQSYIRNWWAGTVIEVSDGGSCGTSVVIQSGDWTHMYCHMQGHVEISGGVSSLVDRDGGIQLWEGQQIIAGDRIGRVGMTGRTTGPHLHWGLKYQGNWVDPAWVLQAMAASHQTLYGQN